MSKNEFIAKVGMTVRPVVNTNGHNYRLGTDYMVVRTSSNGSTFTAQCKQTGLVGNILCVRDCELVAGVGRDALEAQIVAILDEISIKKADVERIKSQLDWMDEMGTDEFDEEEYLASLAVCEVFGRKAVNVDSVRKLISLIKSGRPSFKLGDTVEKSGAGTFWVIIRGIDNKKEISVVDSAGNNMKFHKNLLMYSRKVLTEKSKPFLSNNVTF